MIWAYRLLFPLAFLLALPRYLWRMGKRGGYQRDWQHRFGFLPPLPEKDPRRPRIWIQAVSVGELQALGLLLDALGFDRGTGVPDQPSHSGKSAQAGAESEERMPPPLDILVTTTTSTGYQLATERLPRRGVRTAIFPLDCWLTSRLAWKRINPDLVILMEGELWPEHLHQARRRGAPVLLLNARLSDRSFRRYQKMAGLTRWLHRHLERVLPASEPDAERFRALGLPPEKLGPSGNLKCDTEPPPPLQSEERRKLLRQLGLGPEGAEAEPLILLGSSTWPGEEEVLLETLQQARSSGLAVKLLLVPRHAERRGEIIPLLEQSGLRWHLRSSGKEAPGPVDVHFADTTGELRELTRLGDLVYVGKSLPPHREGQTPIEAAAQGKPQVFGPGMGNFRAIARSLVESGSARREADAPAIQQALRELLRNPKSRETMQENALRWHQTSRGATQRAAQAVREMVAKRLASQD